MIDWSAKVIGPLVSVFGEPVTYLPTVGGSVAVSGIFDAEYVEIDPTTGGPVAGARPVLGVQLSQFAAGPVRGDRLTLDRTGTTYIVREIRPDSHGAAKLLLNVAP